MHEQKICKKTTVRLWPLGTERYEIEAAGVRSCQRGGERRSNRSIARAAMNRPMLAVIAMLEP